MAGLTITVGETDITAYVDVRTVVIEEFGTSGSVATCKFTVKDASGTVSIAEKDSIDIDDDGTTIFAGEVGEITDEQEGITQIWHILGQDYNLLLDETVVTSESYDQGTADDYILGDNTNGLFPKYLSDIDASTYVSQLDSSMEAVEFVGMTLRECLDELAKRTGARYYVDFDKNLHWFDEESNDAAFDLSTSPDGENSYAFGGFRRIRSAAQLMNRVYIVGKEVVGWVEDSDSISTYGEREGVYRSGQLTTSQMITDVGNALLDRYDLPRSTYECWTEQAGLSAGEQVGVVNETWGIDDSFYIRKMRLEVLGTDGEKRRYYLWLDDEPMDQASHRRGREIHWADVQAEVVDLNDWVYDTDAPSAPTFTGGNVTTGVTEDEDGHQIVWIKATWGVVSDADLDHYEIQCADNTGFNYPMIGRVAAGETREYVFSGLVGNTSYYLRVRAVDWVGNTSAWSPANPGYLTQTSSHDSEAPGQVAGLSAGSSRTLVGLQWTARTEADLSYYEIQRADDDNGEADTYSTIAEAKLNYYVDQDFTDQEIADQDTFWYRVRAVDTSGNEGDWATETSVELGQIDTDHLAANCVTANQIAANTITASEIAASTITATELSISTLSSITANMGTLTAGEIRVGTGTPGVDFSGVILKSGETYVIAGYDDDDFQAGLRTSDGLFVAGGGAVLAGKNGVVITYDATGAVGSYVPLLRLKYDTNDTDMHGLGATPKGIRIRVSDGTDDAGLWINYEGSSPTQYPYAMLTASHLNPAPHVLWYQVGSSPNYTGLMVINGSVAITEDKDSDESVSSYGTDVGNFYLHAQMFIGPTYTNVKQLCGVTIDDEGGELIALKDSNNVNHGMTDDTETDTYGVFGRVSSAGGLHVLGYKDNSGANSSSLVLGGFLDEATDTTKSTSGNAIVELYAAQISGTSIANVVSNGNCFAFLAWRGGTWATLMIIDEDGDVHYDGSTSSYDEYDDGLVAQDLSRVLAGEWERVVAHDYELLERMGVLNGGRERPMVSVKRLNQLLLGAVGQLYERCGRYEEMLTELSADVERLHA